MLTETMWIASTSPLNVWNDVLDDFKGTICKKKLRNLNIMLRNLNIICATWTIF